MSEHSPSKDPLYVLIDMNTRTLDESWDEDFFNAQKRAMRLTRGMGNNFAVAQIIGYAIPPSAPAEWKAVEGGQVAAPKQTLASPASLEAMRPAAPPLPEHAPNAPPEEQKPFSATASAGEVGSKAEAPPSPYTEL
jgi:hypothetical protein